jgi:cobalt-zinc-cadmium efflux system outer membrane protein
MKFLSFCPIKLVPKKGIRKESLSAQILRMRDRHMKYRPFIFIIALLAGCARFQPQPISAEKTAVDFDARSLSNEALHTFLETNRVVAEWPVHRWDLNALTFVAFYYQPSLAEARAQLASVRAAEITAGGRPNPSVSLTPTYDTTTSPPWIPGVSFDIPIETAGKRGKRIAQAVFASEAGKWDFVATEWQVRGKVRAALLNLRIARENEALLARAELAQSNVVRLLQGQLNAGGVSGYEVTQARVAAETVQLSRQDAIGQLRLGRVQLAGALGVPARALEGMEFDFGALETFPRDLTAPEIRREAVLHRADIRSALASYAASQAALQLEIAKQYPDVHLSPGYELDQTDNKWSLGLTVDLPVLNQNQGPIAEARAKRAEAAAHFLTVQANAISAIDSALVGYEVALQKSAIAKNLLDDLQKQLDSVRALAQLGESDALALANAEAAYYTGAQNQLDALAKAQQALGELEDAAQSSLTFSIESIRTVQDHVSETKK